MFSLQINFIKVNEGLFRIRRSYKEEDVKNIDELKEYLQVDIVFRKDGMLYFCENVQDLEIINEQE